MVRDDMAKVEIFFAGIWNRSLPKTENAPENQAMLGTFFKSKPPSELPGQLTPTEVIDWLQVDDFALKSKSTCCADVG